MRGMNGTEHTTREIITAWTGGGAIAGTVMGGVYGTALLPLPPLPTIVGGAIGVIAGAVVGFLNGLSLAWIRPAPADVPLVAEAATELVLLPLQIWLWFVIHSATFLPVVVAPSVVSVAVAALLGRRLPPVPGRGGSRGRTTAAMSRWWSIEVRHGEVSAFRWQERHDSALTEAALASGARDGAWHVGEQGVKFEVRFDTEEQWEAFRGLPAVRAALGAVPDPVDGLLICPGVAAGSQHPRPV
jgi:hypothetical protein